MVSRVIRLGFTWWLVLLAMLALSWVSAQPGPRSVATVLYVPTVDKVLVFGGLTSAMPDVAPEDLVWWWDPRTGAWSESGATDAPGAALAFHEPSGLVVAYGTRGELRTGETWLFDPVSETWEDVTAESSVKPTTGVGPGMVYDPTIEKVIMFGGMNRMDGTFYPFTWEYDVDAREWTRVPTTAAPQGRNFFAIATDHRTGRMVIHGGESVLSFTYTYDPVERSWQRGAEGPRADPRDPDFSFNAMVYDHDSGLLVHYGGLGDYANGVWIYDVSSDTWEELVTEGMPAQRWAHGMTSVPGLGVVVFGGNVSNVFPQGPATDELWVLDAVERRWELR